MGLGLVLGSRRALNGDRRWPTETVATDHL